MGYSKVFVPGKNQLCFLPGSSSLKAKYSSAKLNRSSGRKTARYEFRPYTSIPFTSHAGKRFIIKPVRLPIIPTEKKNSAFIMPVAVTDTE